MNYGPQSLEQDYAFLFAQQFAQDKAGWESEPDRLLGFALDQLDYSFAYREQFLHRQAVRREVKDCSYSDLTFLHQTDRYECCRQVVSGSRGLRESFGFSLRSAVAGAAT